MENNSKLEKFTLERRAVPVTRNNFRFQSGFPQKEEEEKFDNSENFTEKKSLPFFVLFVDI